MAKKSLLRCMCFPCRRLRRVSNVYVCYAPTYTHVFGHKCGLKKRINHDLNACVVLFLRIHHFCDPCAGRAYGCVVFLTWTSILSQHMRMFLYITVFWSYVYIIIYMHALFGSRANIILVDGCVIFPNTYPFFLTRMLFVHARERYCEKYNSFGQKFECLRFNYKGLGMLFLC